MTIRYLSFDFDGCLFNREYAALPHDNFSKHLGDAVLVKNRTFLNWLKEENVKFSAAYAFIGSTRQDYFTDLMNSGFMYNFRGSCCSAIKTICSDLGINLDPLMLADIEGDLESGTSFNRIMDEINNNTWMDSDKNIHKHVSLDVDKVDEFKRTILFAQMQKAATEHPNEEIIFDFFDDRLDILFTLKDYFTKHPHLIPKNVHLRLHAYAGKDVSLKAEISGVGAPLSKYRFCLKTMHENLQALDDFAVALKEFTIQDPSVEKVVSIIKEIADLGLFIDHKDNVNRFFTENPNAPFAVHPSNLTIPGLFTFTAAQKTDQGINHIRYGLDRDGKLFAVDEHKQIEIEILPEGLLATLAMHFRVLKQSCKHQEKEQKPEIQAEPKAEKISTGQALYQKMTKSPYFVADASQVKTVLEHHDYPFVIRESSAKVYGMLTFTLVSSTDKGIISSRYGLNHQGELFGLDDKDAYKIEFSGDLLDALKADNFKVKERIKNTKNLESITFIPSQKTANAENKAGVANRLFVAEKGFFANSPKPQPTEAPKPSLDMQY
ncbi:hypothetical protein [Fluoribacter gormanii]|uniref:hypothetical protein n=1 Tax=Fluoribacter gormanii TaxID=464 RepID=UPI001041ABBB|nr:hypothetical protein [Fluoribacter gormanii]